MENIQPDVLEKISSIQLGLLRYKHNGKKISVQVRMVVNENALHCIVCSDQEVLLPKLLQKNVTLIQKDRENYIYIDGRISHEARKNSLLLSIDMKKASWFIRKSKGSVTWLQEKSTYMPTMQLAS